MTTDAFTAGRDFLTGHARLLEQRLFATLFEGAPGAGVVDALRGYRNDDGGFGHALEADKLCPSSLPVDVEVALGTMATVGIADERLVQGACDYLDAVAEPSGAVPLAFPVIEAFPRAAHWAAWTYEPGIFPTAGLVDTLRRLGAQHPWIDRAEAYCWSTLEADLPTESHTLLEATRFLEHAGDADRAHRLFAAVAERLPKTAPYRAEADDPGYGVTPLEFAPTPHSPWRALFDDGQLERHLDRLQRDQQADGGWPLTWEPPSPASTLAWRGVVTVGALRVLTAYGRLRAH